MKIEIHNVTKAYGHTTALRDISLTLEGPELVGLVGPNGAGKTTLMKLLVAQLLPTGGGISVDGRNLYADENYIKRHLGYLPQDFGLYDELSVLAFLDYIATLKRIPKARRRDAIQNSLERTGLAGKEKTRVGTLSGGQKQRVGIAQALLNDPELTIVDEPTVGLDPEERIRFRNLFAKASGDKLVIFSTHIIDDVQSVCSRLVVMNRGSIRFDGAPAELIRRSSGRVRVVEGPADMRIDVPDWAVTSRVPTPGGIRVRVVGDDAGELGEPVEPTLEDAYLYCLHGGQDAYL